MTEPTAAVPNAPEPDELAATAPTTADESAASVAPAAADGGEPADSGPTPAIIVLSEEAL
jgi:hypothetical protein